MIMRLLIKFVCIFAPQISFKVKIFPGNIMEWINGLFTTHSALQTMVLLSLIIAAGLALGKLHVKGISLGVAFVFS